MYDSEKALVSVIITTFHNESYLPRAIESVLNQSYPEIELIVVDDNDPESKARYETERVMRRYPQVKYLRHSENRNGAAARNTGIQAARGKYIAFLDNDDVYFSNHIDSCVRALEDHPDYGCVLCNVVKICQGLCWDLIRVSEGEIEKNLLFSETALGTGSNLFVRADIIRAIDGFDESFLRHQDVEFCLRLFDICKAYCIDQVQIVKEMDGFSNAPDFERFLKTKQHLWKKFDFKLNLLTEQERCRYFARQYSALLYAACKGGNRQRIQWTVSQIKKYRSMNKKEKLLVMLSRMHLFFVYEGLKTGIKRKKSDEIYKIIISDLTDNDLQIFIQTLSGVKGGR